MTHKRPADWTAKMFPGVTTATVAVPPIAHAAAICDCSCDCHQLRYGGLCARVIVSTLDCSNHCRADGCAPFSALEIPAGAGDAGEPYRRG